MKSIEFPLLLHAEGNARGHWGKRAARTAVARATTRLYLIANHGHDQPTIPCVVTIIRFSPRAMDDDNLAAACKPIRDEVALWLRVNDRNRDQVRYVCAWQKISRARGHEASLDRIRIEFAEGPTS